MIYKIHKGGKKPPQLLEESSLSEYGWREKRLEDYFFQHLGELISSDLMVVGQSSPGEKADLVALDYEGDLWLFELKKTGSEAENLLQVMRYSQIFSAFEIDDLDKLYRDNHEGATKSLALAFCDWFGYDSNRAIAWGEKLGKRHHLVVVTDGTDDETRAAIAHWQRHGLDIQAWPYRIYKGTAQSFRLDLPELSIGGKRISQKPAPVFFVNTSRQNEDGPWEMEKKMLKQECALTVSEPWIFKIFNIPSGARVMLYANSVGVIATGIATPVRQRITKLDEFDGEPQHILKLRDFRRLKQPLPVRSVKKIARTVPVSAVYELHGDRGERVWNAANRQP